MSPSSFVSQSDWLVVPGCLSSLVSLHLFPKFICLPVLLASGARLLVFTCLPTFVSQSGSWCPALRMSPSSFVPQSDWLVVPGCLSSLGSLHLFPNLAHGVRHFGCLPVHVSPSLTGWWCPAVCLHLSPYVCFPIWLMVSGSSDVSQLICLPVWLAGGARLFVFTCLPTFVSQFGGCVSSLVSLHLSPALSSGIRIFGCLFFAFTCLSSGVSFHVSPILLVSQLICLQSRVCLCGGVGLYSLVIICLSPSVSYFICLRSYVCLSGGVLF